ISVLDPSPVRIAWRMFAAILGTGVGAQEIDWQFHDAIGFGSGMTSCCSFGDLNLDGCRDLLIAYTQSRSSGQPHAVRILSGRDGSLLWPPSGPSPALAGWVHEAGDMDADGYPDFVCVR